MAPERLTLLREAHGLSQKDLAGHLGVSAAYISQLEAGKRPVSAKTLDKLSVYFRMDKSTLYTPLKAPCNGTPHPS